MPIRTSDVVIVGAGPTGLLLAGDLAAAGLAVTVLERRAAESNLTRAFAVHARTLEELDMRGVADALAATGSHVPEVQLFGSVGVPLRDLPSRFPYLLATPQYETERVLSDRALAAGAVILRGVTVTGLEQDDDGVTLTTEDGSHRAAYVVGADGHRSFVRSAIGLPFPGGSVVLSIVLADVKFTEKPDQVLLANSAEAGFAFTAPFGDGWYRIIAWDRHHRLPEDAPVDFEELRALVEATHGTDYGMHDPRWTSRFHSEERQVPRYRVGRVFLAGDAAHVHSPAGGQGMNTGIQDAANLGWKLVSVLRHGAPDALLDSYHDERHPVGEAVLRNSGALLRIALVGSATARAVRNSLVRTATAVPAVRRRVGRLLSGVGLAYPAPHGAHPAAGERVPDIALAGGGRLYEALRDGRHVLVVPPRLADTVDGDDRTAVVTAADGPDRAVLVRPDGYAAWAADEPNVPGLRTVLGRVGEAAILAV